MHGHLQVENTLKSAVNWNTNFNNNCLNKFIIIYYLLLIKTIIQYLNCPIK